jgi:hypothetical protein
MSTRRLLCLIVIGLLAGHAAPCLALTIDLTSGTTGTDTPVPQSFNETRGVDVTIQGPGNLMLTSMTLRGLEIDLSSGSLGARVYDSSTQALLASADVSVPVGSGETVTIPISATLVAGHSYRLSFFVSDGGNGGSGTMFDPAPAGVGGFPYTESTGRMVINQAYEAVSDAFPSNVNIFVPLMTLDVQTPVPAVTTTLGRVKAAYR